MLMYEQSVQVDDDDDDDDNNNNSNNNVISVSRLLASSMKELIGDTYL